MNLRVFYLYKTVGFGWLPYSCITKSGALKAVIILMRGQANQ